MEFKSQNGRVTWINPQLITYIEARGANDTYVGLQGGHGIVLQAPPTQVIDAVHQEIRKGRGY